MNDSWPLQMSQGQWITFIKCDFKSIELIYFEDQKWNKKGLDLNLYGNGSTLHLQSHVWLLRESLTDREQTKRRWKCIQPNPLPVKNHNLRKKNTWKDTVTILRSLEIKIKKGEHLYETIKFCKHILKIQSIQVGDEKLNNLLWFSPNKRKVVGYQPPWQRINLHPQSRIWLLRELLIERKQNKLVFQATDSH